MCKYLSTLLMVVNDKIYGTYQYIGSYEAEESARLDKQRSGSQDVPWMCDK